MSHVYLLAGAKGDAAVVAAADDGEAEGPPGPEQGHLLLLRLLGHALHLRQGHHGLVLVFIL